jgi:hypothetical protein
MSFLHHLPGLPILITQTALPRANQKLQALQHLQLRHAGLTLPALRLVSQQPCLASKSFRYHLAGPPRIDDPLTGMSKVGLSKRSLYDGVDSLYV